MPEVSLVAILDADKEGFLRSETSLDELESEMLSAADNLEFERAANIRDRIEEMRKHIGKSASAKMFDFGRKKRNPKRKQG